MRTQYSGGYQPHPYQGPLPPYQQQGYPGYAPQQVYTGYPMQQEYLTQKEYINQQPLIPKDMVEETTMENSNSDSDTRQSQSQQGTESLTLKNNYPITKTHGIHWKKQIFQYFSTFQKQGEVQ
jgi:hypothetical protein